MPANVGGINYPSAVPSYPDPTQNPAAYGSIPNIPLPGTTVPTVTGVRAGQAVNQQLPGYGQSLANVGGDVAAETAGQLPQDVVNEIEQQAAERGVATGSPGSPNANAAMLRALGTNSLALTQQGQQNLQSILGSLPGASLVANPSFYPSVGQTQQAQEERATYAAAPQPMAAAQAGVAAANRGVAAGRSSVPQVQPPNYPTSWGAPATGYTTPIPLTIAEGAGVNPGGLPLNTAAAPQDEIDRILAGAGIPGYGGGASGGEVDPETGLPVGGGIPGQEDFTSTGEGDPYAAYGGQDFSVGGP